MTRATPVTLPDNPGSQSKRPRCCGSNGLGTLRPPRRRVRNGAVEHERLLERRVLFVELAAMANGVAQFER